MTQQPEPSTPGPRRILTLAGALLCCLAVVACSDPVDDGDCQTANCPRVLLETLDAGRTDDAADADADTDADACTGDSCRTDPVEICGNNIDDDDDGLVECDDDECNAHLLCSTCLDGELLGEGGRLEDTVRGRGNFRAGSCGGLRGEDYAVRWTAPYAGTWRFDTTGSSFNTYLYLRAGDCDGEELACNDDAHSRTLASQIDHDFDAGETVIAVVDGNLRVGVVNDDFVISVIPLSAPDEAGFCNDRVDNDDDGDIDCQDEDCASDPNCGPLSDIVAIDASASHVCAVDEDGAMWCWGANSSSQLGAGGTTSRDRPMRAGGQRAFETVATSASNTCGLSNGLPLCWGSNDNRQLVVDVWSQSEADPVPITAVAVDGVSPGYTNACVLSGGRVQCQGANWNWQSRGAQVDTGSYLELGQIVGLSGVDDFEMGNQFGCALSNGAVFCWGLNNTRQVGSTSIQRREVTFVEGLPADIVELSVGQSHSCAVTAGGEVWCWGDNRSGKSLGEGEGATPAERVDGLPPIAQVSAGAHHTCAIDLDDRAWCWGDNKFGGCGQEVDVTAGVSVPVSPGLVAGVPPSTAIAAGGNFTCVLTEDAELRCWGANANGQLGAEIPFNTWQPQIVLKAR